MKNSVLLIIAVALVIVSWYAFFGVESYFILWPSIDTEYSKNYNEENFNKITLGMSKNEVDRLMGKPLRMNRWEEDNTITYYYSSDGRSILGDFAWFGRSVTFRDDKVIEIEKEVYYD